MAPEAESGELVSWITSQFASGNWQLVVAGVLMLLVYLVTKSPLGRMIPKNLVPLVASIAGVLASVATNLLAGTGWFIAISNGLLVGAAATGFWEMVGKRFLPKAKLKEGKAG